MPLRIRRGTDAERLTITPLEGELIFTTDTKTVYVGDGTTPGGIGIGSDGGPFGGFLGQNIDLNGFSIVGLGNIDTIGNQTISGSLEVGGGFDVTGNVAVGGNIVAQGNIVANGNITLGAGGDDVIIIDGEIDSNLVPGDGSYSLGSLSRPWNSLYVNGIQSNGLITGEFEGNLRGSDSSLAFNSTNNTFSGTFSGNLFGDVSGDLEGNLRGYDSSIAFDASTSRFFGEFSGNVYGNVVGDVIGSIFTDDSSLLVDALESAFYTNFLEIKGSSIISRSGDISFGDSSIGTIFNYTTISDNLSTFSYLQGSSHKHNVFKDAINSSTPLDTGDFLFVEVVNAQDGTGLTESGAFGFLVDGAVSPGAVPGKFVVVTYPSSGDERYLTFSSSGHLAVNKLDASEALDVEGNGLFSGSVTAASFKGSFVADDSSIIVDGVSGAVTAPTVTASTFVQFPVYSNPTTRDAAIPSPAAGMVVFVTDSTGAGGPPKLQANTDGTTGGWVDL